MFPVGRREQIRARLLDRAREDPRIAGAAITGSAARDAEDQWSDIDLFFGVVPRVAVEEVVRDWSTFVYRELGAIHHFDLRSGPAVYRAFLLGELLEVDLGFTPAPLFGPRGTGAFRLVFGDPAQRKVDTVERGHLIGLCWHHVLHARICVERGALWQAEYWISEIRDHTLALASLRLDQDASYAKGADHLPAEVTAPVREALVASLTPAELTRALAAATRALLGELREADAVLAETLEKPLLELGARAGD